MKIKTAWIGTLLLLGYTSFAQDKSLTLQQAISLATTQSKETSISKSKVATKALEVSVAKNKQLPDLKISGQASYISTPDVDLKIAGMQGAGNTVKTNQLIYGMASLSMPLYAGGKISNSISIAEEAANLEEIHHLQTNEKLASQTIKLYMALYKAQQMEKLLQENVNRFKIQVKDFTAMEANGIIARNDLLKSKLQLSNYEVSLQEAQNNVDILNYQLAVLLNLDEGTKISAIDMEENQVSTNSSENFSIENNSDYKMVQSNQKMAESSLKIAKANYLPMISLVGSYVVMDLKDVVTLTNAATIGIGVSYDLSALYKNNKEVKLAKSKITTLEQQADLIQDKVKVQVNTSYKNYELAKKQELVYQEAVEQANENFRIVKDKYENGVTDTDDLLEADVQQVQSNINHAVAKANTIEKYYDLLLAKGELIKK